MTYRKFAVFKAATSAALLAVPVSPVTAAPPKAVPPVLTCKLQAADGLTYSVIKPGKGEKPGATARAEVNYSGRLAADGTEFDSGKAIKFPVGGVIPGFAQGLQLMQPGGKYRLCIPAALGYGAEGTGPIPGNADLVFEVELLSFTTPPPKPVIAPADRDCAQTTASGLGYAQIKAGNGRAPTDADLALVDFTTFDAKTGVVEEKRDWEKIPLAQASPIFGEGLKMMQTGATYRFCMPKPGGTDAANAPLVNIIVTLLDLRPAPVTD
ncbi:MAG: FKBP-type peptidyl-prolyl cis-trans isomerase [Sphingorhabdus sp.]